MPGQSSAALGVPYQVHNVETRVQYNRLSVGCKAMAVLQRVHPIEVSVGVYMKVRNAVRTMLRPGSDLDIPLVSW